MVLTPATLDPVKPQVLQPRLAELARISHTCSSRSGVGASRWLARTVRMEKTKPHWQRCTRLRVGGTRLRVAQSGRIIAPMQ
jgi:hypothetical protein